jgi:hypothetical protein
MLLKWEAGDEEVIALEKNESMGLTVLTTLKKPRS